MTRILYMLEMVIGPPPPSQLKVNVRVIRYTESNTGVIGNTRFISSVERDIMLNTRNLVFPRIHVFFCLLYKLQSSSNIKIFKQ